MNGILCIDKPAGYTSFDVVARVRGMLKTRKVGHGGTLDPMATGVLPIFVGRATRCCDLFPGERKRYRAAARLGVETDTQDITGTALREGGPRVDRAALLAAVESFRGGYEQVPPMYSAKQINGRRLYDLAREGVEVERSACYVELYRLELAGFCEQTQEFTLDVECSKGTYIRTLCADIAARAGSFAAMVSLRRTRSAGFGLSDCLTLEELERAAASGEAEKLLQPVERVFDAWPRVFLSPPQSRMLVNGVRLDIKKIRTQAREGPVAVYGGGQFLAAARADAESGYLRDVKLFCER